MNGIRVRCPSPALVIAILALVIALGGTSYAAVSLGRGAVKSGNIAPGAVKAADIATGAVGKRAIATGAVGSQEVRDGSLRARDLGVSAVPASTITVHSAQMSIVPNQSATVTASCPSGQRATGGGWWVPAPVTIQASYPSADANGDLSQNGTTATGWAVVVRNGPYFSGNFVTYAECSS